MADERKPLKLKTGCGVPHPEDLFEEYEKGDGYITANIGIDKIEKLVQYFVMTREEPIDFILRLPVSEEADSGTIEYIIEGLSVDDALLAMIRAGKLLFEDGVSSFSFKCPAGDEISFGQYNIMNLYGDDLEFAEDFFGPHKVPCVEKVTTALDQITDEEPGECRLYEDGGKTIFDLPDKLAKMGMHRYTGGDN